MTCRECQGAGTLYVLPGYVDQQEPAVTADDPRFVEVESRRAALANTVYPCPECRPDQFADWSAGRTRVRPLSAPPSARRQRRRDEPLPMEPTWLDPADWTLTRADLQ